MLRKMSTFNAFELDFPSLGEAKASKRTSKEEPYVSPVSTKKYQKKNQVFHGPGALPQCPPTPQQKQNSPKYDSALKRMVATLLQLAIISVKGRYGNDWFLYFGYKEQNPFKKNKFLKEAYDRFLEEVFRLIEKHEIEQENRTHEDTVRDYQQYLDYIEKKNTHDILCSKMTPKELDAHQKANRERMDEEFEIYYHSPLTYAFSYCEGKFVTEEEVKKRWQKCLDDIEAKQQAYEERKRDKAYIKRKLSPNPSVTFGDFLKK